MTTDHQPRLQTLDALRGVAALGVVLFHYLPYYGHLYGHGAPLPEPLTGPLEFGRYGVHLFFILSGFVIFMTLERTRTAGWFAMARASRLLPALWAGIFMTYLCVQALGPENRAVTLPQALLNLTLLHEYLGQPHVDGAYWSLVVEVTFYVWIAALFFGMRQWSRIRLALAVWLAVSYTGVIFWKHLPGPLEFLVKDLLFVKYAPLFIAGILVYRWYRGGTLPPAERILLAFAMGHALLAYKAPFNLFVLACHGLFLLAVFGYLGFLANRPLLWLGRLSYSLYLIHQNIGYGVLGLAYRQGLPPEAAVPLAVTTALALACLLHYGIERPCLERFRRYRERQDQRPGPDLGQTACPGEG